MNPIRINLEQLKNKTIPIGREGENEYTVVRIDCGKVFREHPQAEVSMKVKPPKGIVYPVTVQREGNEIIWTVKDYDLASKGDGQFQLTFTDGTVICKTAIGRTLVLKSLEGNGPAPTPIDDWMQEAQEALDAVEDAEVNQPMIGEDGYWYTWNQEAGEYQKTDTKAQGEAGPQGPAGPQGETGPQGPAGDPTTLIDDTSTAADKAWSAAKSNTLLSAIQEKSNIFKTTKTGNPLIVSDKLDDAPFDSFVLDYLPVQDGVGVPSPTNIRQFVNRIDLDVNLSGEDTSDPNVRRILFPVHGKNVYDDVSFPLTQGRYIGGANGALANSSSYAATTDYIPCDLINGKTVTLNKRPGGTSPGVAFYSDKNESAFISGEKNNNASAGNPWTFDVPSTAKFMRFTVPADTDNIQIEIGQSSTSYEPFKGTGYGGSINLKTGLMTVEYVCETAGSGAWTVASSGNAYQFGHTACNWGVNKDAETQLCSHWHNTIYYNNGSVILNANGALYVGIEFWQAVGITPTAETVAAYFAAQKAAGTPLYVCAKLKTPYEIQLSMEELEAIAGKNIVWSGRDTAITATYSADTKGYIDRPSMDQKRILVFGDSLWGADRTEGVADFLKEHSGATVFNAGIGGTMINGDRVGSDAYKAFDGANLIHAFVTGDYTDQNAYQTQLPSYVVLETLPMLKALDIRTIDILILAYGTNDYEAGKTVSATATAFLTAVSELLTVNPKMRIICILPPWRMFSSVDGDVYENSNNQTTVEFADGVCDELQVKHILTLNMSRELPWRAETKEYYMDSDAVHPNKEGNKIYAHVVNGKLRSMY